MLRKVGYFSVETPHSAGQGHRILVALRRAGVDLLAYSGFPEGGKAKLVFVPAAPGRFTMAARKLKLKISPKKVAFLLEGRDKVGALTGTLGKLAKAKINLTALTAAVAGKKRFGAIFWVKPKDVVKTSRLLRAK